MWYEGGLINLAVVKVKSSSEMTIRSCLGFYLFILLYTLFRFEKLLLIYDKCMIFGHNGTPLKYIELKLFCEIKCVDK